MAKEPSSYSINVQPSWRNWVDEGRTAVFCIERTGTKSAGEVRFFTSKWPNRHRSATPGKDFDGRNETIYFRPGQKKEYVYINVRADRADDVSEYFYGNIAKIRAKDKISGGKNDYFIIRNPSALSKNHSEYRIWQDDNENIVEEGKEAVFKITRTGKIDAPGKVKFYTQNNTASVSTDYQIVSKTIAFKANQEFAKVKVKTYKDADSESVERFWARLGRVNRGDRVGAKSYMYINNGNPPTSKYRLSKGVKTVKEGGFVTFRILRTGDIDYAGSVKFFTTNRSGDTATAGADYTGVNRKIKFKAGEAFIDIKVATKKDSSSENLEKFSAVISKVNDGDSVLSTHNSAIGKIRNGKKIWSKYSFSALNFSGKEGGTITFRINRSGDTDYAGKVHVYTKSGTARQNKDYIGLSKIVKFEAGLTNKDITVKCKSDIVPEAHESFKAIFAKVYNSDVIGNSATGLIGDVFTGSSYKVAPLLSYGNEGERATFRISRTRNTKKSGKIRFFTSDYSAQAGSDYVGVSKVVLFAAGVKYVDVKVRTLIDNVSDDDEKFYANLKKLDKDDHAGSSTYFYIKEVQSGGGHSLSRTTGIGTTSSDLTASNRHDDQIIGSDVGDLLIGGLGNDVLLGGGGNDQLKGGSGADRLIGGSGLDRIWGGASRDTFVLSEGAGFDRIMDFRNGQDRIQVGAGVDNLRVQNLKGDAYVYEGRDLMAVVNGGAGDLQVKGDFLI